MGSATPSQSGDDKHKGTAAGGRPGPAPKPKDSRGGGVRASEGTNPCTRPSFATKNVFDVLQDLSESIGGSPGPQLDAADGQPEPIVHDLHQSLVELLERPEILSLHAVRRVGRERQLHLKVRALCGEVEKVFDVWVNTGAQVSLVKAGLLPPECLTDSRKPVRLKVANGQYMVGGTKEAAIGLQFVNHRELSRPDLGKEILLQGPFYEAEMNWDMIVEYDFMMETDSGVLPAKASMTLYQDDQLSWLSSPEHHGECQWIHPERNQLEVTALGTEPTAPANQEYGVMPEVASRVVADLGASDPALDAFSSGTSAHIGVCEKYWSAQDSAWKKHWGPHQGLMWIHCPRWAISRAVAKIRKGRSKADKPQTDAQRDYEFMGGNDTEFFEHQKNHQAHDQAEIPTKYCSLNYWRFKDQRLLQKLQQAIHDDNHHYAFWDAWQFANDSLEESKPFSARHAELLLRRRKYTISQSI